MNTAQQAARPFRDSLIRLCVLATVLIAAAASAESPGKFEITPFAAGSFGGTFKDIDAELDAELDDSTSFGVILNLRESANTQWELIYLQQASELDTREFATPTPAIDVDVQYLQIGGTYLGEGNRARPYVAATIGGTRIAPTLGNLNSDTFWSASIGAGLQVFPTERIGLRLEGRVWGTLLSSSTDLFCSSGSQGGLCAIAVDGDALWQFTALAGVVVRF
ncbi:MAG: outer membrane beta-barrel protein [Pseudomonadota bacterium]